MDGEEEGRQTLLDLAGQAAFLGRKLLLSAGFFGGLATLPFLELVLEGLDILTQIVGDAIRRAGCHDGPFVAPLGCAAGLVEPSVSQRFILSRPEQYFWLHRRFKRKGGERDLYKDLGKRLTPEMRAAMLS